MKVIILFAALLMSAGGVFASGTSIGNGGNGVICKNSSGHLTSVELLDYYELRLNGKTLSLDPSRGSFQNVLNDLFDRWMPHAPVRMAQYKKWLTEFTSEAGIYSGVEIPAIPDTGTIVIPTGCELKPIAFQRPDSEVLPGVKRYTISKDLWDLMPEVQKAGLVLHELIYREGIKAGHRTSFSTRYFNGYLASAAPNSFEYAGVVSQMPLLWTEYAGNVIVEIGQMVGSWGCTACDLSFERKSDISPDGRTINILITSVLGDLEIDELTLRFAKQGRLNKEEIFRLSFSPSKFSVGDESGQGSFESVISEIALKDRFELYFRHPVIRELPALEYDSSGYFYFPRYPGVEVDSDRSWYNNRGEILKSLGYVGTYRLSTIDSIWEWDREVSKFVKTSR